MAAGEKPSPFQTLELMCAGMAVLWWFSIGLIAAGAFAFTCRASFVRLKRAASNRFAFLEHVLQPLILLVAATYLLLSISLEAEWVLAAAIVLIGLCALLLLVLFGALFMLVVSTAALSTGAVFFSYVADVFSWLGVQGGLVICLALLAGDMAGYGLWRRRLGGQPVSVPASV